VGPRLAQPGPTDEAYGTSVVRNEGKLLDIDLATPGLARIVGSDPRLDTIAHGLYFGEGPVWDRRNKRFLWTYIIGDTIWQ